MATRIRQTVKRTTTRTRVRKASGKSGYRRCNMCRGSGYVRVKK